MPPWCADQFCVYHGPVPDASWYGMSHHSALTSGLVHYGTVPPCPAGSPGQLPVALPMSITHQRSATDMLLHYTTLHYALLRCTALHYTTGQTSIHGTPHWAVSSGRRVGGGSSHSSGSVIPKQMPDSFALLNISNICSLLIGEKVWKWWSQG